VAVIDQSGTIVRHLAAGVLGGTYNPPSPLKPGLSQSIAWDGKDDTGFPLTDGNYKVRVRLGIRPVLDSYIDTKPLPGTEYASSYIARPTDSTMRIDHPIFNRVLDESNPKLMLTVHDADDRVYVKTLNSDQGWRLVYYKFNGLTGALIDTLWRGQAERVKHHINGEIAVNPAGDVFYYSSGYDYIFRFTELNLSLWPVSGIQYISGMVTEHGMVRGHTVGPGGFIYNIHEPPSLSSSVFSNVYSRWQAGVVAKIDSTGTVADQNLITVHAPISCVRVDAQGNIYVGARVKPRNKKMPGYTDAALTGPDTAHTLRWWAEEMYGSVLKFGPQGGGLYKESIFSNTSELEAGKDLDTLTVARYTLRADGLEWAYFGLSPMFSHYGHIRATAAGGIDNPMANMARLGSRCLCQVSRFDVDGFGRVFLPDAFKISLVAVDNNRNRIFIYGHKEFWADNDAQIRSGQVRLPAWPHAVEVTDRRVYVADQFHNQIMVYRLEADAVESLDIPIAVETGSVKLASGVRMANCPNPFNSATSIIVRCGTQRGECRIRIFNLQGRIVRDLGLTHLSQGKAVMAWDGKDNKGIPVSTGIYQCCLKINSRLYRRLLVRMN
jgi:hypothetical protein